MRVSLPRGPPVLYSSCKLPPVQESKTIFKRLSYDARSNTSVVHCESPERSYPETFVWDHTSQATILNGMSFQVAPSRAARIRSGSVWDHLSSPLRVPLADTLLSSATQVHLQFLGHPIANDPIYQNTAAWGATGGKGGVFGAERGGTAADRAERQQRGDAFMAKELEATAHDGHE